MARTLAGVLGFLLIAAFASAQSIEVFSVQTPAGDQAVQVIQGGPGMPARDTPLKTGTSRIRGHVFAADGGQPLRRAQVRAFSPELREQRLATTDAQGAYEFKDLPAGRYTLNASKGSYVGLQYGQTRPLEPGKPLEILDAQTVERVDFSLPHGSIITGRVVDEFGEPIADVQVMPMRYQFSQGRRRLMPNGRLADQRHRRVPDLRPVSPGQYVSATAELRDDGRTPTIARGTQPTIRERRTSRKRSA